MEISISLKHVACIHTETHTGHYKQSQLSIQSQTQRDTSDSELHTEETPQMKIMMILLDVDANLIVEA